MRARLVVSKPEKGEERKEDKGRVADERERAGRKVHWRRLIFDSNSFLRKQRSIRSIDFKRDQTFTSDQIFSIASIVECNVAIILSSIFMDKFQCMYLYIIG